MEMQPVDIFLTRNHHFAAWMVGFYCITRHDDANDSRHKPADNYSECTGDASVNLYSRDVRTNIYSLSDKSANQSAQTLPPSPRMQEERLATVSFLTWLLKSAGMASLCINMSTKSCGDTALMSHFSLHSTRSSQSWNINYSIT